MALFAILATAFFILVFSGISAVIPFSKGGYWNPPGPATANLNNGGAHGLSELLYAFTSQTENNGSAFAGITVNTPWYDLTGGLWTWLAHLDFSTIGYLIIGVFLISWLGSTLIYRLKKYDSIEVRPAPLPRESQVVGPLANRPSAPPRPLTEVPSVRADH